MKAILYDMDGVLVDTEPLNTEALEEVIKELGITLSDEEKKESMGITTKSHYTKLFKKRNLDFSVSDTAKMHFKFYEKKLTKVTPLPGAIESIKRFKDKYKLAIVTGSNRNQANLILKKLGVISFFDVIITCDDVKHSKPHPQPYLEAAKQLCVKPSDCVVIEDTIPGIESGKAAGMKVIGVKLASRQNLGSSAADKIIESLNDISLELIEKI